MADYLNKYANDGAGAGGYNNTDEQSARAALGNTVSLVESTGEVHYDGVNVERPANNPMEGDVLYLDANGGKHFVDEESLVVSSIPASWKAAGVVAYREGNNVMVMDHHDSGTMTFTSGWMHAILGMQLSGTQTITFQQWNGSANADVGMRYGKVGRLGYGVLQGSRKQAQVS